MSNSKNRKRHPLDESSQLSTMKGIRKPMPPSTKVIQPKVEKPQKANNWREFLDGDEEDNGDDYQGIGSEPKTE